MPPPRRTPAHHHNVRKKVAQTLADVDALRNVQPRFPSMGRMASYPTTEFWLRPENRLSLGTRDDNPLINRAMKLERRAVQANDEAAEGNECTVEDALVKHIDLFDLVAAKRAFIAPGANGAPTRGALISLSLGAFTRNLARVCQASEAELTHLFMKIDHGSDGCVSWNDFLAYVVQFDKGHEASLTLDAEQEHFLPKPRPAGALAEPDGHRDKVSRLLYVAAKNHYISAANDGTVRVWDATTLEHVHTTNNGPSWVLDMVHLEATSKLVVAAADRTIAFYEMSAAVDEKRRYTLYGRASILDLPLCCTCWVQGADTEVLGVGDDTGCVTAYDARALTLNVSRNGEGRKPLEAALVRRTRLYTLRLHSSWLTSIVSVPSLRALLTAAHDSLVILTDLSALPCELVGAGGLGATAAAAAVAVRDETDAPALHTLRGHTKGVHALATLSVGGRHLGVSASLDRRVVLWQLETGEEVGALIGHRSHVVAVAADRAGERLVTLGADGEMRIWELAGCTCAQVISPSAQDALRGAGALCYNAAHECIATGAHALTIWQPRKHTMPLDVFRATSLGPRGHKHPLVAIVHSPLFNLVLSADEAAVICLWELASGALLFRFEHAGGARLGCMAFDSTGRRLLTGAEDGCVRLYGFSSGELLRSHRTDGSASGASGRRAAHAHELTAVLHIADCGGQGETVAAVGGRQIWLWHQPQQPAQARDGADGQQPAAIGSAAAPKRLNGHRADILTLAFAPPVWLVTGSSDGELLLWDLQHCDLKRRLRGAAAASPERPPSSQGAAHTAERSQHGAARTAAAAASAQDAEAKAEPAVGAAAPPQPPLADAHTHAVEGLLLLQFERFKTGGGDDDAAHASATEQAGADADADAGADASADAGGMAAAGGGGASTSPSLRGAGAGKPAPRSLVAGGPSTSVAVAVSLSADGALRFWLVRTGALLLEVAQGACQPGYTATALAADARSPRLLVTADSGGYVQLRDLAPVAELVAASERAAATARGSPSAELAARARLRSEEAAATAAAASAGAPLVVSWRAHTRGVIAVEWFESHGVAGFLTAGVDCTVRLWSLAGELVGVLGQSARWRLGERSSWLDPLPAAAGTTEGKDRPGGDTSALQRILPAPVLAALVAAEARRVAALRDSELPVRRGPTFRELRLMFETDRENRPRSARARSLLETKHHRGRKPRAHDAREFRIELAALPLRGTIAPPPDALRRHMSNVLNDLIPQVAQAFPWLAHSAPSNRGGSPYSVRGDSPLSFGSESPLAEFSSLSLLSSGGLSDTGPAGGPHSCVRLWRPHVSRSALPLILTPQPSGVSGSPTRQRVSPQGSPLAGDAGWAGRTFGAGRIGR